MKGRLFPIETYMQQRKDLEGMDRIKSLKSSLKVMGGGMCKQAMLFRIKRKKAAFKDHCLTFGFAYWLLQKRG